MELIGPCQILKLVTTALDELSLQFAQAWSRDTNPDF
jgi:hypothetical protein